MTEQYLDPLEQFTLDRQNRVGKRILFEGEELVLRSSVAPEVFITPPTANDEELLASLDRRALMCLEKQSWDGWRRLRDPERDMPLSLTDVIWLLNHLVAEASGLPTDRPVDSSTGPQPTNGSSKEGSRSKAKAAKG